MIRTTLLAGAVLALTAVPALAHQCPKYFKANEAAIQASSMSAAEKAELTAANTAGLAMHTSGDHHDSEHALVAVMIQLL